MASDPDGVTTVRAAIYARYSSELQRPTSIEDQIRKCRQAAEQNGWVVLAEHIRSDSEISGATLAPRAGLLSLISEVKKRPRPFDVIVIDDTSRFGRNLTDVLLVSDLIKCHDAFLYFVSQGLNSKDKNFRLLLIMNGMIDEQYLAGISEKVHRGQEGRVLNGLLPAGRCYGYRNVPIEDHSRRGEYGRAAVIGVQQEIVEEEAMVIRHIFQMRSEGYTMKSIAIALNSEGIPPPSQRDGCILDWSPGCIPKLFHQTKYRGQIIWNKTHRVRNPETGKKHDKPRPPEEWVIVEAPELRIVSEELWDKVHNTGKKQPEELMARGRPGGLRKAKPHHHYLFSGLLICGDCGGRMVLVQVNGDNAKYGCVNHHHKHSCSNHLIIRHLRLEEQLVNRIVDVARRGDNFEYMITQFHDQLKSPAARFVLARDKAQEDVPKLRVERRQLHAKARNLASAIAECGTEESPSLLSELKHIERRIETINKLLGESKPKLPGIPLERIREFLQRKASNMSHLILGDRAAAKRALLTYFKPIVLMPEQSPDGPVFVVLPCSERAVATLRPSRTELELVTRAEDPPRSPTPPAFV